MAVKNPNIHHMSFLYPDHKMSGIHRRDPSRLPAIKLCFANDHSSLFSKLGDLLFSPEDIILFVFGKMCLCATIMKFIELKNSPEMGLLLYKQFSLGTKRKKTLHLKAAKKYKGKAWFWKLVVYQKPNTRSSLLGGVLSPLPPLPPILFLKCSISPASPSTALPITFLDRIYCIFFILWQVSILLWTVRRASVERLLKLHLHCLMPCNTKISGQSAHAICKKTSHTQNQTKTKKLRRDQKNMHLLCLRRKGFLCFLIVLLWTSSSELPWKNRVGFRCIYLGDCGRLTKMDLEEDRLPSLGKRTGTSKMLLPVF